jgi:dipeptidyl aminopeptidase/acylaminoacyl peptidase
MTTLVDKLRVEGRAEVELLVFPDEDHFFQRHASWLAIGARTIDFFDRRLAPAAAKRRGR